MSKQLKTAAFAATREEARRKLQAYEPERTEHVLNMASLAINNRATPQTRKKYFMEVISHAARSGVERARLVDAFLITISAVATTDVEPSVKEELVDAITGYYYYLRGDAEI